MRKLPGVIDVNYPRDVMESLDRTIPAVGLVLLVGAWGSLGDVARSADPHQDHGTLAQLKHLPGWLWLGTWFLADAAATAWVGWLAWGLVA